MKEFLSSMYVHYALARLITFFAASSKLSNAWRDRPLSAIYSSQYHHSTTNTKRNDQIIKR